MNANLRQDATILNFRKPILIHMKLERLAVLLLVIVATSSAFSHAQQASDFDYKVNTNGTLTITGYVGSPRSSISVPATINGKKVETLGEYFLDDNTWLKKITIGEGIKNIAGGFEECYMLNSVIFPSSLRSIGSWAFVGCESLEYVTLPKNLETIGDTAFAFCEKLKSISIAPSNAYFKSIDGVLFNKSASKLLLHPGAKAGTYKIPNTVTTIGELAFGGCINLSAIDVEPSNRNYKSIGGVLFNKQGTRLIQYPAGKLGSSYTIPNGVKYLEYESLARNLKLSKVVIPNTVTDVGEYTFYACRNLSQVSLPIGLKVIPEGIFDECYSLKQINIPESITSIGDEAFDECYSLETLHLPKSLRSIGHASFGECRNLTSISIDEANPNYAVKEGVLFNKNFTELIQYPAGKLNPTYKVPDGIVRIKDEAFDGTQKLVGAVIPASVAEIGAEAFSECIKLQMMVFLGDAPQMSEWFVFDDVPKSMKIFYLDGASGFSLPDWYGFTSHATPIPPITGFTSSSFTRDLSSFITSEITLKVAGLLPKGLAFNASTGILSGNLTGTPSASFVKIQKTNGSNVLGEIVIPYVILPSVEPKITSSLSAVTLKQGTLMTRYTVSTNFGAKSFSAKNLPTGLKLDATTGVVSGKPTKKGTFTVTFTAAKKQGTKVVQTATGKKVFKVN
jgi:hypothetical protein